MTLKRFAAAALGCLAKKLKNPKLKVYYYTSGNPQIRVALTADMMKLKHAKIPPTIVFPIPIDILSGLVKQR